MIPRELTDQELKTAYIRQPLLQELVGIGERGIQKAATRMDTNPKHGRGRYMLYDFVRQYIAELQGGGGLKGEIDAGYESARVDRERADKLALDNAERRGEVRDFESLVMVNAQVAQIVIGHLNALPGRVAGRLAAETGADPETVRKLVQAEVDAVRTAAADGFERWAGGVDDLEE